MLQKKEAQEQLLRLAKAIKELVISLDEYGVQELRYFEAGVDYLIFEFNSISADIKSREEALKNDGN
jgi:hypothetical protein